MKAEDLKEKNKPELLQLAERAGLNVDKRMTRVQILSALTLHYTARAASRAGSAKTTAPPMKGAAAQTEPGRRLRVVTEMPTATSPQPAPRPAGAPSVSPPQELPARYHEDQLVLMARDPYWVHAYWEIRDETLQKARGYFGRRWDSARQVLRVYDVTGVQFDGRNAHGWFDIELNTAANNWYINVPSAARAWCADIGVLDPSGEFYLLVRSNTVHTPRAGMSDVIDEKWMGKEEDFRKIYALSGGHKIGIGSLELRELMEKRFKEELASGFVSSLASAAMKQVKGRGFRFIIDAELIVYGATEPDATVTIQGKTITLRPDGTFTLRFALPDGRQVIPAVAASADGVEERTIALSVARNTEAKQPRILERV